MAKKQTNAPEKTLGETEGAPDAKQNAKQKLPAFSMLVSGLQIASTIDKTMGSLAFGDASEDIKNAWAELCEPRNVMLMALNHKNSFFSHEQSYRQDSPPPIAPGYSKASLSLISMGLDRMSQEIEALAESNTFKKAALQFSPMLASPSPSNILSYPLLQSGLKVASATLDGVKTPTLSGGHIIAVARDSFNQHNLNNNQLDVISDALKDEIKAFPATADKISLADKQFKSFYKTQFSLQQHYYHMSTQLPALYLTVGTLGRANFIGEVPLPSIAGIRDAGSSIEKESPHAFPWIESPRHEEAGLRGVMAKQMRRAAQLTRQAAFSAISAAMKPTSGAFNLQARDINASLSQSPLLPIDLLNKSEESIGAKLRVESGLYSAIAEKHGDISERLGNYQEGLLQWLRENINNDTKTNETLERAYELNSKNIDAADQQRRARYRGNYYSSERNVREPFKIGAEGSGLSGVRAVLMKTDPRIGLSQWATTAIQSLTSSQDFENKTAGDEARDQVMESLKRFSQALSKATSTFASTALSEAEKVEMAWLDERDFGLPWKQACSMGLPSQKSIAWAKQNPMEANLASSDPIARMASHSARALGIRAAEDAVMVDALRSELEEMGLSAGGFEVLKSSESLRSFVTPIIAGLVGKAKTITNAHANALPIACKAISASARVDLPIEEVANFAKTLITNANDQISPPSPTSALGHKVSSFSASSAAGAELFIELAKARANHQGSLFDALARDWKSSRLMTKQLQSDSESSLQSLTARIQDLVRHMPPALSVDWRLDPFNGKEAWEIFGGKSARFQPVVDAARAEGGLAKRCSEWAALFDLKDAADSNDLIGQCKQQIKAFFNLSEGGWKAIIKSEDALNLIDQRIQEAYRHVWRGMNDGMKSEFLLSKKDQEQLQGDRHSHQTAFNESHARIGLGINLAISQNVPLASALISLAEFSKRAESVALFSTSIETCGIDSVEAADFYIKEERAKAERMPKIFKEACKRFEKLENDHQQARARGAAEAPLPGREALASEITDLTDWIKNSEYGVWQTLPKDPTWGQLSRLSRAWHDEMAAREADRISREKAKQKEEEELINRLNPFAPRASEHWEPIIGTHARDGWEAVELTSQAQLSEEGQAMSHCVSSYSSYCREGMLRLFSIRLNGERKCTMELRSKGQNRLCETGEKAGFSITQNKGRHNAAVTNQATQTFCLETVAAAEASWGKKWSETQALIAAAKEKERLKQEKLKAEKKALKAELAQPGEPVKTARPAPKA